MMKGVVSTLAASAFAVLLLTPAQAAPVGSSVANANNSPAGYELAGHRHGHKKWWKKKHRKHHHHHHHHHKKKHRH